jgi:hypothetical protein
MQRQQLSKWCWAAIAVSIADYYQSGGLCQADVASTVLGVDCSDPHEAAEHGSRYNTYADLDRSLRSVGCFSHWSPGRPTFARLCSEIDAGRPLCLSIVWRNGGSHYVVVIGYHAETREIYVEDPLHGPSVHIFDKFPHSYWNGGFWRGTFWTSPPGHGEAEITSTETIGTGGVREPREDRKEHEHGSI